MITLALAQMIYFFFLQAPFTGGEDGLQGVPRGKLFGLIDLANDLTLYYVVLAIFVAVFLLIIRTVHSPFGQVLKAIRENEPRAISLGYDVDRYKLLAFVLSAGAGRSGRRDQDAGARLRDADRRALVAVGRGRADDAARRPGHVRRSGRSAPSSSSACRTSSPTVLVRGCTVIIGVIFVVCVLAFRKGIVGELLAWRQRRAAR